MGTDFAGHEHVQTVKTRAHHYCSLGGSALSFLWAQKLLAHARTHTHTRHTHTYTETHANTRVSCNVGGAKVRAQRMKDANPISAGYMAPECDSSFVHTAIFQQIRIKIYYDRTMPKK